MSLLPINIGNLEQYGYGAVALVVGIESMGIPFPGEATLLAVAIYAGTTHHMSIAWVIVAAAAGAITGDNIGFWVGRESVYRFLLRYGRYVRLTDPRIKLAQYIFLRHGGRQGRVLRPLRHRIASPRGVSGRCQPDEGHGFWYSTLPGG